MPLRHQRRTSSSGLDAGTYKGIQCYFLWLEVFFLCCLSSPFCCGNVSCVTYEMNGTHILNKYLHRPIILVIKLDVSKHISARNIMGRWEYSLFSYCLVLLSLSILPFTFPPGRASHGCASPTQHFLHPWPPTNITSSTSAYLHRNIVPTLCLKLASMQSILWEPTAAMCEKAHHELAA
jgi:hypothetical protein